MQINIALRVLIKRIKAIRFMMKDKTVAKRKKALIVFGIVYLFLPVDLIPPVIFPIGFLDDLILWIWILWTLKDTLDQYWMGDKAMDLSKKYAHTNNIDDADFEINSEDKDRGGSGKNDDDGGSENE